jgi:hypothetical protein
MCSHGHILQRYFSHDRLCIIEVCQAVNRDVMLFFLICGVSMCDCVCGICVCVCVVLVCVCVCVIVCEVFVCVCIGVSVCVVLVCVCVCDCV